jgi:WD40 repeat protein
MAGQFDLDGLEARSIVESSSTEATMTKSNIAEIFSVNLRQINIENIHYLEPLKVLDYQGFGAFAWSRDGRNIAWSSGFDIWLLKLPYQELKQLKGHFGYVASLDFTFDGKYLVSGGHDRTIRLWNMSSASTDYVLQGHSDMVVDVACSANGKIASAGSWDQTARLWDIENKNTIYILNKHTDTVLSVSFNPNSNKLASAGGDQIIHIWDTNTGNQITSLQGHSDIITELIFKSSGDVLVSSSHDNTIRLWDVIRYVELRSFHHHENIQCISFDSTEKILALADISGTISFLNYMTGDQIYEINAHTKPVTSIVFDPVGKLFCSGSSDGKIIFWGVTT